MNFTKHSETLKHSLITKFGQKKSRELKSVTGAQFVITYHPKLREIASIMKKYQNILYQDELLNESILLFQWFHIVMLES